MIWNAELKLPASEFPIRKTVASVVLHSVSIFCGQHCRNVDLKIDSIKTLTMDGLCTHFRIQNVAQQ